MNQAAMRGAGRRSVRRRVRLKRRGRAHHVTHSRFPHGSTSRRGKRRAARRATLLTLVQEVQRRAHSDAEVVRVVRWMVNRGVVVLSGNFAGQRIH